MQEIKDPTIKLFGQKIPSYWEASAPAIAACEAGVDVDRENEEEDKDPTPAEEVTERKKEAETRPNAAEANNNNNKDSGASPEAIQNPKTPSIEEEAAKSENGKSENDQSDANNSSSPEEKALKKPDKLLPCPRCHSMDTKFCYYNNYNVNQPRYFCKACQRYWTAGGTMRNVPVGAGRRKSKSGAPHYRHITISEALQAATIDVPNGIHLPALKTNGRVLSFGIDPPICDSVASILNLAEEKALGNGARSGFHGLEDQRVSTRCKSGENGDDCSSVSSITVSNSVEETGKTAPQDPMVQGSGFLPPQVPCVPGFPWSYQWNSAVPSPALCPPGFPISFYHPTVFWNCGLPGNWNVPWYPSHPSAPNTKSPNSNPKSPTLGKHSRDDDRVERDRLQEEEPPRQRNGRVLVPKTLRIDDPSEAAKSSIWATLGIKNECVSGGGMFKAFQSKKEEKNHVVEASSVLRANPAALSRSLNFHENS